ncbi:MAG: TonB-dependent receptor, partial [Bacteroidota bacterium]
GKYRINGLKPGAWNLKLSFMGYKTIHPTLLLSRDTIVDFSLEQGSLLGEEVNIVATRAHANTPTTYSTMTMKEIEKFNTGQDLPYILQNTPSVVTTSDAGTGIGYTSMNIRGSDLTRINVTMNGIPVNDAESQGVWFVDLPDLASSCENIQVQRGVGTSTNGPGAFGASVNIRTSENDTVAYGQLDAAGGSFGTIRSTLRFGSGLISRYFALDGRVSYLSSNGYIDRASTRLRSIFISGGYFGKSTTIKFNLLSGHEKTYQAWEGLPKDSLKTNRTYNPAGEYIDQNGTLAYYKNQTDNYTQTHCQLLLSQELGQSFNLNAALFYTKGKGFYESYKSEQYFSSYGLNDVIDGKDTITNTNLVNQKWLDNDFYGLTFSVNLPFSNKLKVTVGGAWSYYNGLHYGKVTWAQYASNGDNERHWYDNSGKKSDLNFYIKTNYQLFRKVNLFVDLQYRHINYSIHGTLESLAPIDQEHKFNFFNPKAGISCQVDDKQKLYFSFAVGNREPNRNNYEVADSTYLPAPEKLFDYELGYGVSLRKFKADVCLFYMDYKDILGLKWNKITLQNFSRDCMDRQKFALVKVLSGYKKIYKASLSFFLPRFIT